MTDTRGPTYHGWYSPSQGDYSMLFKEAVWTNHRSKTVIWVFQESLLPASRILPWVYTLTYFQGGPQIVSENKTFSLQVAVGHGNLSSNRKKTKCVYSCYIYSNVKFKEDLWEYSKQSWCIQYNNNFINENESLYFITRFIYDLVYSVSSIL